MFKKLFRRNRKEVKMFTVTTKDNETGEIRTFEMDGLGLNNFIVMNNCYGDCEVLEVVPQ